MSCVRRGAARWLILVRLLALAGCAGGPDVPVTPQPDTTVTATPPAETTPVVPESQPPSGIEGAPTETETEVAVVPPEAPEPEGTPIVVATPQERAVAEARELAAGEGADAQRLALERLLKEDARGPGTEGIRHPDGQAVAWAALARFRQLAPERLPELIPILTRAHTLVAATADTQSALGRAYYMSGQLAQAERSAAEGLTIDPLRVDLLLLRAQVLTATDRWVQARTPLETVLRAEPQNADALILQAEILWRYARDIPAAVDLIQNASTTHPEDLRFPEMQGYISYEQGQRELARLVLRSVLTLDPGRTPVIRFLLKDAIDTGSWSEAADLLQRLGPIETEADLLEAQSVYRGLGDHELDVQAARRLDAMAADRRHSPLLARSLIEASQPEAAITVITEALSATRAIADTNLRASVRSSLYYLRAAAAGEPFTSAAVSDLQRALAEDPANSDAMFAMARHLLEAGQPSKAQQYARSALRYRPDDPAVQELLRVIEERLAAETTP